VSLNLYAHDDTTMLIALVLALLSKLS